MNNHQTEIINCKSYIAFILKMTQTFVGGKTKYDLYKEKQVSRIVLLRKSS